MDAHEFDTTSRVGALLSLSMYVNTHSSVHSFQTIEQWLPEMGFCIEQKQQTSAYTYVIVVKRAV